MSTTSVQTTRPFWIFRTFLLALAAALVLVYPNLGRAQDQQAESATTPSAAVVRDPRALTLVQSAVKALAGPAGITDVTLQASAVYVAGSDEQTGTATLIARGNLESRVLLNLGTGHHTEVRNRVLGTWTAADGTVHSTATHNCWTDASWFLPVLTLQAVLTDSEIAVAYLGTDTSKSKPLVHLRLQRVPSGQTASATSDIARLSTMDFYLDPQTFVPLAIEFTTHPDSDANTDIPIEIQFGDFRDVNGAQVPFRIQKLVMGTLTLDLSVSNATINSGLSDTEFLIVSTSGGLS